MKVKFSELIKGYDAIQDEGTVLLDRIRRIKKECERKNFDKALNLLRSRFWTYRPLRNLLRTYPEVDKTFRALFTNTGSMSPEDRHRFQWYFENKLHELEKHEGEIKIFAADAIKELSRGKDVGIGKLLFHLKKEYDPTVAEDLDAALERIERELINLVRFTESDLKILRKDSAIVKARADKVEQQIRSLKNLEHTFVEALRTTLAGYNKVQAPDNAYNWIDWTKTTITSAMPHNQLYIKILINFRGTLAGVSFESSFQVTPSDVTPGEFKVKTWAPDGHDWVESKANDIQIVAEAFKSYRTRLIKALNERAASENKRIQGMGIHRRFHV